MQEHIYVYILSSQLMQCNYQKRLNMLYAGIPPFLRGRVWEMFINNYYAQNGCYSGECLTNKELKHDPLDNMLARQSDYDSLINTDISKLS